MDFLEGIYQGNKNVMLYWCGSANVVEKMLRCHIGNSSLNLSALLFPPIFYDGSSGAKKVNLTLSLKF